MSRHHQRTPLKNEESVVEVKSKVSQFREYRVWQRAYVNTGVYAALRGSARKRAANFPGHQCGCLCTNPAIKRNADGADGTFCLCQEAFGPRLVVCVMWCALLVQCEGQHKTDRRAQWGAWALWIIYTCCLPITKSQIPQSWYNHIIKIHLRDLNHISWAVYYINPLVDGVCVTRTEDFVLGWALFFFI